MRSIRIAILLRTRGSTISSGRSMKRLVPAMATCLAVKEAILFLMSDISAIIHLLF
jgi:hypothetical protein